MAYRSPALFSIERTELCLWLEELIASLEVGIQKLRAQLEVETVPAVKERTLPAWIKKLEDRLEDARTLASHVHPDASFSLSSEELLNIRRNLSPVEIDLDKIRLAVTEEDAKDTDARSGYIAIPGQNGAGLIKPRPILGKQRRM